MRENTCQPFIPQGFNNQNLYGIQMDGQKQIIQFKSTQVTWKNISKNVNGLWVHKIVTFTNGKTNIKSIKISFNST